MKLSQFILQLYVNDVSLESLIRDQYEMAKKGISWEVSSCLPDFERFAIINLIAEDYKREAEQWNLNPSK